MSAHLVTNAICSACGKALDGSPAMMVVEQKRIHQAHPICRPCEAKAEASPQGFADIQADIRYWQEQERHARAG